DRVAPDRGRQAARRGDPGDDAHDVVGGLRPLVHGVAQADPGNPLAPVGVPRGWGGALIDQSTRPEAAAGVGVAVACGRTAAAVTCGIGSTALPESAGTMKSCQMRAGTLPPTTGEKPSRAFIGVSAVGYPTQTHAASCGT